MTYKAVISDLDGTLLNKDHKVSDYTKSIIKKIVDKGIKFFIATGRHHVDAFHIKKDLGLDTILITSNGARVHDNTGEVIFSYDIEETIIKEILSLNIDNDIHANIYKDDEWYVEKENKFLHDFHSESGFLYNLTKFNSLTHDKIAKIFFICDDYDKLLHLKNEIDSKFSDKVSTTFSLPVCLEVMAKNVSKGTAIEKVLEKYNIGVNDTIAFGDGLNDLEMLQTVGKGILMGNATDKLKEKLSHLESTLTNEEHGVAKYLECNL